MGPHTFLTRAEERRGGARIGEERERERRREERERRGEERRRRG